MADSAARLTLTGVEGADECGDCLALTRRLDSLQRCLLGFRGPSAPLDDLEQGLGPRKEMQSMCLSLKSVMARIRFSRGARSLPSSVSLSSNSSIFKEVSQYDRPSIPAC